MSTHESHKLAPAERVTATIAALLERGVRPWKQPWADGGLGGILPLRANGAPYRGMNVLALWAAASARGYTSPFWFTFKQALAHGGQVRKGEHGAFVIFYKPVSQGADSASAEQDEDAPRRRTVLRGYVVFNRDQIEGLEQRFDPPAIAPPQRPDALATRFAKVPAVIREGGARAFYTPSSDHVQMPPKTAFADLTQYYATLAHELGHWTRHPSRLNRDFGQKRYGDHGYAMEELAAELCAAFVGAAIGLPPDHLEDHAAYLDGWLSVVKEQPSAFLTAAGKAQLAADYLLRLMGEQPASDPPGE